MGDRSTINGALEWIPDAVLILGGEGRILLVNAAAERLFGYSRAELIGGPIEVCLPAMLCDRCLDLPGQAGNLEPRPIETLKSKPSSPSGLGARPRPFPPASGLSWRGCGCAPGRPGGRTRGAEGRAGAGIGPQAASREGAEDGVPAAYASKLAGASRGARSWITSKARR